MTLKNDYFECNCDSSDHTIRICYFINDDDMFDPNDDEIYLETQLPSQPFFGYWTRDEDGGHWWSLKGWRYTPGRWVRGIRYIFGYTSKYGHWETTIIKYDDAVRLRDLLNKFINSGRPKTGKG